MLIRLLKKRIYFKHLKIKSKLQVFNQL